MSAVDVSSSAIGASFRNVQRQLAQFVPGARGSEPGEPLLELFPQPTEPARLIEAELIEPGEMRAHVVPGAPEVGFAAFLDGTQASRVLAHANGVAIVHGTVAAVVRQRRDRRLVTWTEPVVRRRIYAPLALLSDSWRRAFARMPVDVVDTSDESESGKPAPRHPFALRDTAIHRVQKDREAAERELAERWCSRERDPLFIDGGISGSERVAVSSCTVGVVKSHRTLYAQGDDLSTILALKSGERSSVFRVTSPKRTMVASWYLRMRDDSGHDPMFGLVRVEVSHPGRQEEREIGGRADRVSRWILAEAAPLALPDSRWDRMVYGIRDCEEFLRAIQR